MEEKTLTLTKHLHRQADNDTGGQGVDHSGIAVTYSETRQNNVRVNFCHEQPVSTEIDMSKPLEMTMSGQVQVIGVGLTTNVS